MTTIGWMQLYVASHERRIRHRLVHNGSGDSSRRIDLLTNCDFIGIFDAFALAVILRHCIEPEAIGPSAFQLKSRVAAEEHLIHLETFFATRISWARFVDLSAEEVRWTSVYVLAALMIDVIPFALNASVFHRLCIAAKVVAPTFVGDETAARHPAATCGRG